MQISQKQKTFFEFFFAFLKSIINFTSSPKKMTLIAHVFPKLRAPKDVVGKMSKKSCFREPFDRQRDKWFETLLQSQRQHLYHIY